MVIEFKLYCGMRHALKRTETQKLQIASVILKSVLNPFYLINQREKIQLLKTSPLNFTNFKMLRKKPIIHAISSSFFKYIHFKLKKGQLSIAYFPVHFS